MKSIAILFVLLFSCSSLAEDLRVCPKQEPFPAHSEKPELSEDDYEYEKHIYELKCDEINDISYKKYQAAFEYLENDLPRQLKVYGDFTNSSELSGNFRYHTSAINAYTLRKRALVEFYQYGKGEKINEFCKYLSTLEYHP